MSPRACRIFVLFVLIGVALPAPSQACAPWDLLCQAARTVSWVVNTAKNTVTDVGNTVNDALVKARAIAAELKTKAEEFIKAGVETAKDVATVAIGLAVMGAKALYDGVVNLMTAVGNMIEDVKAGIARGIELTKEKAEELCRAIGQFLQNCKLVAEHTIKAVEETVRNTIEQAKQKAAEFVQAIKDTGQAVIAEAQAAAERAIAAVQTTVANLVAGAKKLAEDAGNFVAAAFQKMAEIGVKIAEIEITIALVSLGLVILAVEGAFELGKKAIEAAGKAIELLKQVAADVANAVQQAVVAGIRAAQAVIQKAKDKAIQAIEQGQESIREGWQEGDEGAGSLVPGARR